MTDNLRSKASARYNDVRGKAEQALATGKTKAHDALEAGKVRAKETAAVTREKAKIAAQTTSQQLDSNPLAAIAGGLAIGAIIAAALPRTEPRSYLGLQVPGFPNLVTITGPGSPSVLTNMPVAIEQHVEWITDCLASIKARDQAVIEATARAEAEWTGHVATLGANSLFADGESWYLGSNVPGKPRVFLPYAGGVPAYRERCAQVAAQGYAGFTLSNT